MKKVLFLLSTVALLGAGCSAGPAGLRYTSNNTTVTQDTMTAAGLFYAPNLAAASEECGTDHNEAYYDALLAKLGDAEARTYTFAANGDVQEPAAWTVTIVPNVFGYAADDLAAVKDDFDICAAGADLYPAAVSADWVMFESACGTGYDDGYGDPVGCAEAKANTTVTLP